jgi:hypothetical protein
VRSCIGPPALRWWRDLQARGFADLVWNAPAHSWRERGTAVRTFTAMVCAFVRSGGAQNRRPGQFGRVASRWAICSGPRSGTRRLEQADIPDGACPEQPGQPKQILGIQVVGFLHTDPSRSRTSQVVSHTS